MEFDLWYLVALPALFAAGWLCRGFDRRQRSEKTQLPENFTRGVALLLDDEPDKAIDVLVEVCRLDPDLIERRRFQGRSQPAFCPGRQKGLQNQRNRSFP